MPKRARLWVVLGLLALLTVMQSSESQARAKNKEKKSVVYVCACLQTSSCSCMTEAKREGPCACGTQGGPPLKEVPSDSNWAKANRDALAK